MSFASNLVMVLSLSISPQINARIMNWDNFIWDRSDTVLTKEPLFAMNVRSSFDCAAKCVEDDDCQAVFYHFAKKACKLYKNATGEALPERGWMSWKVIGSCPKPPVLDNAEASYISRKSGYSAIYNCLPGFSFHGSSASSLCSEDDAWEGIDGVCKPMDCSSLTGTQSADGVYVVTPTVGEGDVSVFCDMTDDGGGWTVLQRRKDGSENFERDWDDYKNGFGSLTNEFWLGNIIIWRLINQRQYELKFDLEAWNNERRFALYSPFKVNDESDNFRLALGTYSGDAGDSFAYHNNMQFTTRDRDNDEWHKNCAEDFKGGWWYKNCHNSNLNGIYNSTTYGTGVIWSTFGGFYESMKYTSMKIRPINFSSSDQTSDGEEGGEAGSQEDGGEDWGEDEVDL